MAGDAVIAKYLARYAEPIAAAARGLGQERFDVAVVVPVYSESPSLLERFFPEPDEQERLFIFVVNAPSDASDESQKENEAFARALRKSGGGLRLSSSVEWIRSPFALARTHAVLLDVSTGDHRLKAKEGVGRARKMGLDFALQLFFEGALRCAFCGTTDADVRLDTRYFSALSRDSTSGKDGLPPYSGLLFPYRHLLPETQPDVAVAMMQLELSFRHYVLGLAHAGSPYAYHSLGSSIAVSLPHYARVRGVPNRMAGEDFHLLAKLSKLAPLKRVEGPTIEIQTRLSERVPFGTGPSLSRVLRHAEHNRIFYHPDSFELLRVVLSALREAAGVGLDASPVLPRDLPTWVQDWTDAVWKGTRPLLASCPDGRRRLRRLAERVDALATLQFIHEAHRNGLEKVVWSTACELLPFVSSAHTLRQALALCEQKERELETPAGLLAG